MAFTGWSMPSCAAPYLRALREGVGGAYAVRGAAMTGAWSRLVGMAGVGCDPSSNRNASRDSALDVILLGAIVATVFFLPLSEGLKNLSYSIALACYLGALRRFTRSEWSIPPVGTAFLLFLCVAVLSAATSAFPWKAFSGVWEMFRYTSFFFIVRQGIRRSAQVVAVLWAAWRESVWRRPSSCIST